MHTASRIPPRQDRAWRGPRRCRISRTLLVSFALLISCSLPGWTRDWHITDYRDVITVSPDGSARIEERIALEFNGSFRGIHRRIPIEYPDARTRANYSLFLKVQEVTDDAGNSLKYETKRKSPYLELTIYVPGAVNTTRTVRIVYTVRNATRYFNDYDEFWWEVTGHDWAVPIDHASALVSFPPSAAGSLRAQAFTGLYGSHAQDASSDIQGSMISIEATAPLPMRGGLSVDIALQKGILQPPGVLTRMEWFLRGNAILFLPLVALAIMFSLWWYKGKDPDPGRSVAPMYEPPDGFSPAETGALIDDSIDPRDITSTVVDLAVRGFIKIEETTEKHLLWSNKDYIFHLLKPPTEWTGLRSHELVTLQHMFEGGGDSVRMSALKNQFYAAIPVIKRDLLSALKSKGMYTIDPQSGAAFMVGAAIAIAVPFFLLQAGGVVDFTLSPLMMVVCIPLALLIVFLFGRQMTAKSLLGVRTRVKILGFQEFMNRVDADRLKRMPPETFEKYLPYAMALGVEHHWAEAFKDILTQPPQWYTGPAYPGMYWNPILFTNTMSTMSTDLHHVMVAAPRANASGSGWGGGGGGGGFSGGGFGGGGGDAF